MKRLDEAAEQLMRSQLDEAWNHYRHCESMRTQYLTFFLTAYVGATGFAVNLLKSDRAPGTLFGIAVLVFVLFCFSAAIYVAVVRLGMITYFYFQIKERTRAYFFEGNPYATKTWAYEPIGAHPPKPGLFSIQGSATFLVAFLCLCLVIAQVVLAVLLWKELGWMRWRPSTAFLGACAMAFTLVWMLRKAEQVRATNRSKQEALHQQQE